MAMPARAVAPAQISLKRIVFFLSTSPLPGSHLACLFTDPTIAGARRLVLPIPARPEATDRCCSSRIYPGEGRECAPLFAEQSGSGFFGLSPGTWCTLGLFTVN